MNERRCPETILRLFDREETKAEGRRRAVLWMTDCVREMSDGDAILIPHPETGALMRWVKDSRPS